MAESAFDIIQKVIHKFYINSADRSLLKLGEESGLAIPHGMLLQKKGNTG